MGEPWMFDARSQRKADETWREYVSVCVYNVRKVLVLCACGVCVGMVQLSDYR